MLSWNREKLEKLTPSIILAKPYDLGSSVGEVPQSPQAVLHESLAGVSEVNGQGLHAAGVHDGGLVARAHGQHYKWKGNL